MTGHGFACSSLCRTLDSGEDARRRRVVALEDVAADPGEHQALEPFRRGDRGPQQRERTERETDRVDRPVWQRVDDAGSQVGVRRGIVRLRRGAVTQQVDPDHVPTGIGQQGGETGPLPGGRERTTPPVHEDHWDRHGPQRRAARRCS